MTVWDFDRIGSLLDNADNVMQRARECHSRNLARDLDAAELLRLIDQVDRDVSTIKSLLKRERRSRD